MNCVMRANLNISFVFHRNSTHCAACAIMDKEMTHRSNDSNAMCQLLLCIAEVELRLIPIWYIEIRHDGDSVWSHSWDRRLIEIHKVGGKDLVARSCNWRGDVPKTFALWVRIFPFELVLSEPISC